MPVAVQEIPEVPVVEWIQEQSAVPDLVSQQISTTSVEASQVVGSFPLLEDFAAGMYNQVHQEQIVATVQEQRNVQVIPDAQVVERIQKQITKTIPQQRDQRTDEQNACVSVPTVQEQMLVQGIPGVQVVERIQKQIAETIPQERDQSTVEQSVCMSVPLAAPRAATVAPVDVYTTPAPVIDLMPTPVIEYIAPSAAVSYPSFFPSFSQPNEAITGLVNP